MNEDNANAVRVRIDCSIYRLNAVKKAAYRFLDRFHVTIESAEDGVTVAFMAKRASESMDSIEHHFYDELLDQELREEVATETAGIRNLLMAQAFSNVSLLDPIGDGADYKEDLLGIAHPHPAHPMN